MTLKDYLVFFRWKNVLMILLIQFLFKYILFEKFNLQVSLDHFHFILLALSTAFVAIAGYIVNDIHDIKADIINKPDKLFVDKKITRIMAQNLFIGFNSAGLLLGMYLSYHIGHTSYFIIYVLTSLLLYEYAKNLKNRLLIGNILISIIVFFCILIIAVFDIAPVTSNYNLSAQGPVLKIVLLYGGFGFILTFLREVVKDAEDIEGDKAMQARSIAIVMGERFTKGVLLTISSAVLLTTCIFSITLYQTHKLVSIYLGIMVSLPLLYTIFRISRAKEKKDFHNISSILKLIMLLGMLSLILI
jgi:4-hydroxybenzoate polyprenyltransferase